tara:strand:- start:470 stop:586 length:117 start_codon:yes stop_codon:yes gene_type:complete
MVFGPGGYHFVDYLRIGLLLNAVIAISAIVLIPMVWLF